MCAPEALAKVAPAQRLDDEFARVKSPGRLALLNLFGERRCSIEAESAAASTDPRWRPTAHPVLPTRAFSSPNEEVAFMSSIEDQLASPRAAPFSNCPRCGLSIRPKARWMAVEHCPRCVARARVAVKMFSSPLPAAELYEEGHAPASRRAGCSHDQSERFKIMSEPPANPSGALTASDSPIRLLPSPRTSGEPLRIAVLAPPWIPVPPQGYGGIEAVVDLLCEALVERGHEVTLFAAPGSRSAARVHPLLNGAHPNEIGSSLYESDYVACAWEQTEWEAERGEGFDVVHDHSGFTALAMADRVDAAVVHTIHGALDRKTAPFYQRHGHKALLVAITRSQADSAPAGVRISRRCSQPHRRRPLAAARTEEGLPAVDRTDGPGQGRAPRDRGGATGGPDAHARRPGAGRAGALLPRVDRAAYRRSAGALRRRGRRGREAGAVRERGRAVDAGSLAGAVRDGDGRGARVRHAGDRVRGGRRDGDRDRRARTACWWPTRPRWPARSTACIQSILGSAERAWPSATTRRSPPAATSGPTARRSVPAVRGASGSGPRLGLPDTGSSLNQRARADEHRRRSTESRARASAHRAGPSPDPAAAAARDRSRRWADDRGAA